MTRYVNLRNLRDSERPFESLCILILCTNPFSRAFAQRTWRHRTRCLRIISFIVFRYAGVCSRALGKCLRTSPPISPPSPLRNDKFADKYFTPCYLTSVLSSSFLIRRCFDNNGAEIDCRSLEGTEYKMRNSSRRFIPEQTLYSFLIDNYLNATLCCHRTPDHFFGNPDNYAIHAK